MISLSKYKEIMGDEARDLSDEEIGRIRDVQYQFARLAFRQLTRARASAGITKVNIAEKQANTV